MKAPKVQEKQQEQQQVDMLKRNEKGNIIVEIIYVKLNSLSDIMFDRFRGEHGGNEVPAEKKIYMDDNREIFLPKANIESFLFNETGGIIKVDKGKVFKEWVRYGKGFIVIEPEKIYFTDNSGKRIKWDENDKEHFYKHGEHGEPTPVRKATGGRLLIKAEKTIRPVLRHPWFLSFRIILIKGEIEKIKQEDIKSWFDKGGLLVALGTYRNTFGRFYVPQKDGWIVEQGELG